MNADKRDFYRLAAKRFAASTLIYKVDSLVHVEDKDDIWFWHQILTKFRPGKYKFLPGSNNEKLKHTSGCWQCLKYREFLSQRFFICIDSDLRFLKGENIKAAEGILQTYTYSWENHCCFAEKLQQCFNQMTGNSLRFDFKIFLKELSRILYKPFLLMLHCEEVGLSYFNKDVFKRLISLQYKAHDEENNGEVLLNRIAKEVNSAMIPVLQSHTIDFSLYESKYAKKGVNAENEYLYIRGHALYNLINSIGSKICEQTGIDFEQNILMSAIYYQGYEAIEMIEKDVEILKTIRLMSPSS